MRKFEPNWPAPLPPEVEVAKAEPVRGLNLSQLAPEEKRAKWAEIRRERPELAALLSDPAFQALRETFDADIYIDEDEQNEQHPDSE